MIDSKNEVVLLFLHCNESRFFRQIYKGRKLLSMRNSRSSEKDSK